MQQGETTSAEGSKGLEADASQQAEEDLLTLEVVQGTRMVGGAYSGGGESIKLNLASEKAKLAEKIPGCDRDT